MEQADALYARTPNRPELISDVQRRAARHLGLDRPWLVKIAPMQDCPACGEPVKTGVALCRHCGAVLDESKAARFGVLRPAIGPRFAPGTATAEAALIGAGGAPGGESAARAGKAMR